jgi:resolvase-like protein
MKRRETISSNFQTRSDETIRWGRIRSDIDVRGRKGLAFLPIVIRLYSMQLGTEARMMGKTKRVGLYVRVSTDSQQTDMQESELRSYAEAKGWVVEKVYADQGFSGAKNSRPALDALWVDCRKRRLDICMVWALDRLSRSLKDLIEALDEFRRLGIDFVCLKQELDTSTSGGRLLFHVVASL